jgi:hypothetical protein
MHAPAHLEPIDLFDRPTSPPPTYTLWGWRYYGHDQVTYDHQMLIFGGPALASINALACTIGNRRRRAAAHQAAQPKWHPIGAVVVSVYPDHLVLSPTTAPASAIWLTLIDDLRLTDDGQLEVVARCEAPYRFAGPGVTDLAAELSLRSNAS